MKNLGKKTIDERGGKKRNYQKRRGLFWLTRPVVDGGGIVDRNKSEKEDVAGGGGGGRKLAPCGGQQN